ncbi:hypothetical protein CDL12_12701 [Handroanthus impetiginosus]|uniref:Uncharacterized protein n=1 Tax=Handroanthus impetiginosus TaxID=429701 RepID=A0A2G9HAX5_9LAMI|nr:hypothetical protein CDL12_12701 [Handroanthus impetiginosus]
MSRISKCGTNQDMDYLKNYLDKFRELVDRKKNTLSTTRNAKQITKPCHPDNPIQIIYSNRYILFRGYTRNEKLLQLLSGISDHQQHAGPSSTISSQVSASKLSLPSLVTMAHTTIVAVAHTTIIAVAPTRIPDPCTRSNDLIVTECGRSDYPQLKHEHEEPHHEHTRPGCTNSESTTYGA